jgi:hypothetical protein
MLNNEVLKLTGCCIDDMARQATLCLVQLLPTMGKNRVSYATAAPLLLEDVNVSFISNLLVFVWFLQ